MHVEGATLKFEELHTAPFTLGRQRSSVYHLCRHFCRRPSPVEKIEEMEDSARCESGSELLESFETHRKFR